MIVWDWTMLAEPLEEKAMARHRTHRIALKKRVAQELLAGQSLHDLARRHDVSRNLIRIWVTMYEAGDNDEDGLESQSSALAHLRLGKAMPERLDLAVGKCAVALDFLAWRLAFAVIPEGSAVRRPEHDDRWQAATRAGEPA